MAKTPVYLITGFLGSGKTTFIKKAIDFLTPSLKVAVVQNEFAPSDIDGKELKRHTTAEFDLLEINNGTVFCLCLLSSFIKSLHAFAKNYPSDIILLEASGLSDPIAVGQVFNSPELQQEVYLAGNICVVDAKRFDKQITLLPRVKHQVMVANHIIINKVDEIEDISTTESAINKLNPLGLRHKTEHCSVDFATIFEQKETQNNHYSHPMFFPESGKPDVQSAVHRSTKPLKVEHISDFLDVVTKHTWRTKGYILLDNNSAIAIQSSMGDYSVEEMPTGVSQTELVTISPTLTATELKQIYQNFV